MEIAERRVVMKKILLFLVMGLFVLVNTNVTQAAENEVIKLPPPQKEGGMPLMKALNFRKSTRGDFGPDTKLSMQQISNLLWAADGVNRPGGYRTAPSAVNWQNIDIYVTTADGLFLYDADKNELKVLGREDVRSVSGMQDFVNNAPVNLIYVADFAKAKWQGKVMDTAEVWSFAGTGAICQNVYLWCASEGLACIVRAMVDKDAIRKTLKLRDDQHVMLAQTIAHFKK
jgi:SagB-type dehydrogenase family enzyme